MSSSIIIHFRSLIFAIVATVTLILFARNIILAHERLGLIIIGCLLSITLYAAWRLAHRFVFAFVPGGVLLCSLALLYFIDSQVERQFFAIGSGIIYYIALLGIVRMRNNMRDETARSFFSISLITMLFFFYAALYGVYINFQISLWVFIIAIASMLFSVTFISLYTYSTNIRRVFLYSIVIAFAMSEIAWMINFWPFGYLTNAAVSLMFYYVMWDMALMTFMGTLSKQRTLINIGAGLALLLIVLFTSQWVLI